MPPTVTRMARSCHHKSAVLAYRSPVAMQVPPMTIRIAPGAITPDRIVRSVCSPNCTGSCGINVHVKDGKMLKVEPADFPDPRYRRICLKGISMAMQRVDHEGRIRYPMLRKGERGGGEWQRLSWDDAFDYVAGKLDGIAKRYGPESNAWISMTGNYGILSMMLSSRVANSLGGTAFSNLGLMGDLGANMGFLPTLGVHQESNEWPDIVDSKLIILFGKNIADTAHSDIHFMFEAMEKGARVVSIDPRFSRTSTKADQWIPIRPGTDAAMILGMMQVIIDSNLHAADYLRQHSNSAYLVREDDGSLLRICGDCAVLDENTGLPAIAGSTPVPALDWRGSVMLPGGDEVAVRTGFNVLRESLRDYTPEKASALCDVPAETIRSLALEYARTDPASLWIGQGTQRYYNGHQSFRALITLGAICGNIGKRHAGVSWGGGSLLRLIFATPASWLMPGGRTGRVYPGTRMHEIISSGAPYPIKSLWAHNYGFGTQAPRRNRFIREALPQLDLFAVSELVWTQAAQLADIVLPATSYYEEEADVVASWNNMYVQLRTRAIDPVGEAKPDWDIFKGVCERLGQGEHWRMSAMEACEQIVREATDPCIRDMSWEELREKGVTRAAMPSPHVPFADLKFPTPSGHIEVYTESLVQHGQGVPTFEEPLEGNRREKARRYPLTFMSNHSMYSANATHMILPWIREVAPEPRVEMHPHDAAARGLQDADPIRIYNDRGAFVAHVHVTEGIKPGALNLSQGWWPEHFISGHYSDLTQMPLNAAQETILESNYPVYDCLVEVERAMVEAV